MNSKYKYYILTGSQKVTGSIPVFSTQIIKELQLESCNSFFVLHESKIHSVFSKIRSGRSKKITSPVLRAGSFPGSILKIL